MRKLCALLFGLFVPLFVANAGNNVVQKTDATGNWYHFNESMAIPGKSLLKDYSTELGFGPEISFQLKEAKSDNLGFTHYRYEQFSFGVKVEGAQFLVHERNGISVKGNGRVVKNIDRSPTPKITGQQGFDIALDHLDAPGYYWEDPAMEAMIKHDKNDPNASYFPVPELVFMDETYSQDASLYRLAWKYDIFANGEVGHKTVFVSALDGSILFVLEGNHTISSQGTAVTRYHGTRSIIADSIAQDTFRLFDATRNSGVHIKNAQRATPNWSNTTEFLDFDNHWDNANSNHDEVAGDCMWAMARTSDYFDSVLNRSSYDDQGSLIRCMVHWDLNVVNAFWNGNFAAFGDGNGDPLTYIDVVSHELSHGVTGTSSGLVYNREPGALNESFSDIFGSAVEFWAFPSNADWKIGTLGFTFRSMESPNLYGDPDTYLGTNWWTSSGDFFGVHTNSGVQNFWYYLLVEGGSGTNDLGDPFHVNGVGFDTASIIAYRNLVTYLTPSSQYADAHVGAIQSAIDLYGCGSYEMMEVARAWQAVGIGADTVTNDLAFVSVDAPLSSSCDLTSSEPISFTFQYFETICGLGLGTGDVIPVGYRVNGGADVIENITLTNNLADGDILNYTFNQTADLSAGDVYEIDIWVGLPDDFKPANDGIRDFTLIRPVELGNDFHIGFINPSNPTDSFYIQESANAESYVNFLFRNTSTPGIGFGLGMTGKDAAGNYTLYSDTASNFLLNQSFISRACMCVDATQADSLILSFDLKQTYSQYYQTVLQLDLRETMSNFRVMINGNQAGPQYHPTTNSSDVFVTHYQRLNSVAGANFELCFEGQNIFSKLEDPILGGEGDYSLLDNVRLNMYGAALGGLEAIELSQLSIFPNPSDGKMVIEPKGLPNGLYEINVIDIVGEKIFETEWNLNGTNNFKLDLRDAAAGIYFINVGSGDSQVRKKILIE